MKTLFIAAGPLSWASSRYRAWWVSEALQKMGYAADCFQFSAVTETPQEFTGYDNYIWQKTFAPELVEQFGGHHYYDACDPAWWWEPGYVKRAAKLSTAVVCSNEALAADFGDCTRYSSKRLPVYTIPDRFKVEHFTRQKSHEDVTPIRFIWFGIAVNRVALYGALANMERLVANGHEIELTICDDRPDAVFQLTNAFPVYHTRWTLESEVEIISNHDIALLPPYPGAWGRVKSPNKSHMAMLCGIPAWDGMDYETGRVLVESETERGRAVRSWYQSMNDGRDYWWVEESAKDWLRVFEEIV